MTFQFLVSLPYYKPDLVLWFLRRRCYRTTDDGQGRKDNDGRQPIEISHLSDSGDLQDNIRALLSSQIRDRLHITYDAILS